MYELRMNSLNNRYLVRRTHFAAALLFFAVFPLAPQSAVADDNKGDGTLSPVISAEESKPHTSFDPDEKIKIETPADTDHERDYSKKYNGAFVEYSVRGGLSLSSNSEQSGWNIDAGMRHSFPALLGDFRVAYRYDRLTPDASASTHRNAQGLKTASPLFQNHSVGGYLGIHPGYLLLLGNSRLAYTLASLHAEIGFGAEYSIVSPSEAQGGDSRGQLGPFVSIGVGLNMPILNADVGYAPWLHVLYRWHISDFDGDVEAFDVDMHILQIGLGWRINGLLY